MPEITTKLDNCHFTSRATLVALGLKVSQWKIMETIGQYVTIPQKTVQDSPLEKLSDALLTILAGGQGLVEANKLVGSDRAIQRAFGRGRCAEQSVISETLNACTAETISQMNQAWTAMYRQHSEGYRHNYQRQWQLLDIDLSGQPCGPKAAFASKGYFAHQRNRRGRQLGRVWASWYEEVLIDQLYPGNTTLHTALPQLVSQAAEVLQLDAARRQRTILRIDAHGGHVSQVNLLLQLGYQVHTKEGHAGRAEQLAATVKSWYDDPKVPGRQVGWVNQPPDEYVRPVHRIAVRTRKKNGQWGIGVIVSSLSTTTVSYLVGLTCDQGSQPQAQLLAYVYFYDLRAGGVEVGFKQDKQGLGITKRNKKRFEAQQMLTYLNSLAHNLLIWFRRYLAQRWAAVMNLGLVRFIRDVLQLNGCVFLTTASNCRCYS
ncbi:MAG TPA: transposase [Anaerolineae bacterium]|nr:transposase [Anaerolineae bacterium]